MPLRPAGVVGGCGVASLRASIVLCCEEGVRGGGGGCKSEKDEGEEGCDTHRGLGL